MTWVSGHDLSVCVATYNGAEYIHEQLTSVVAQLPPGSQVVVVDDGSSDRTPSIVRRFARNHPNLQWVLRFRTRNSGHMIAFCEAVNASHGQVVMIADQDDIWPPGRIEALVQRLDETGASAVFGSLHTFRDSIGDGPPLANRFTIERGRLYAILSALKLRPSRHRYGSACAFRRTDVPLEHPWLDSYESEIAIRACLANGVVYAPDIVTYRRIHGGNQTSRRPILAALRGRLRDIFFAVEIAYDRPNTRMSRH